LATVLPPESLVVLETSGVPDGAQKTVLGCAAVDREMPHGLLGQCPDGNGRTLLGHCRWVRLF